MTEEQRVKIGNLQQSCQQAEDALSQGMEKLRLILAEAVATGQLGEGSYIPQVTKEKLEALERFVNQVITLVLIELSTCICRLKYVCINIYIHDFWAPGVTKQII